MFLETGRTFPHIKHVGESLHLARHVIYDIAPGMPARGPARDRTSSASVRKGRRDQKPMQPRGVA